MIERSPITPYDNANSKKEQVAEMFNRIAFRYDFLNHFLSLGIDRLWRKKAIAALPSGSRLTVLDVATGTGDLGIDAVRKKDISVIGIDISPGMLRVAEEKIKTGEFKGDFRVELGDSEHLNFSDGFFDVVMVSFGVRNFEHLELGLAEIYRVLKPTGKLIILEFSKPVQSPFKQVYQLYFKYLLPFLGEKVSKDKKAYDYLHRSVIRFPDGIEFTQILEHIGFANTNFTPLSLGICTLYTAHK